MGGGPSNINVLFSLIVMWGRVLHFNLRAEFNRNVVDWTYRYWTKCLLEPNSM